MATTERRVFALELDRAGAERLRATVVHENHRAGAYTIHNGRRVRTEEQLELADLLTALDNFIAGFGPELLPEPAGPAAGAVTVGKGV